VLRPRGRKEKEGEGERRRKGKEKKEKEEKKRKKKRKKEGRKRKGKEEKEKKEKENKIGGKFFRKSWKIVRGIWRGVFAGFSRFSGVGAFSRDGGDGEADRSLGPRRARDSRPVSDRGVGKARTGAGLGAVPAGFAARASGRERGEEQWLGSGW
jgi:hypothetical protein